MSDINNAALDTKVTKINPKGRGGWVAVTVMLLVGFEGMTNAHDGISVGTHQSFDPAGVNTICYGHIEDVKIGQRMTKIQCQKMLADDLPRYETQLEHCVHVAMPGYRHAAILSWVYNVGGGACQKSSVARYINSGEWQKGCDALLLYDKAAGKVLPGLVNRRKAERKLCYNVDEPPLPHAEVAALPHVNVDQLTADKEAKATPAVAVPLPKPAPKPVVAAPAPKPAPVAPAPWYTRLGRWFMEK